MWCVYVLMLIIWFTLLYFVLIDEYYLWHILPNSNYIKGGNNYIQISNEIKNCYFHIKTYPIIKKLIFNHYGSDIGCIILEYYNAIKIDNSLNTQIQSTV
eukprot:445605_1